MVLGIKTSKNEKGKSVKDDLHYPQGTSFFESLNRKWENKLQKMLTSSQPLKTGQARTYYNVDDEYQSVVVVGLGPDGDVVNKAEGLDEQKENVRQAIAGALSYVAYSGIARDFEKNINYN